jgi:hypothetical protein
VLDRHRPIEVRAPTHLKKEKEKPIFWSCKATYVLVVKSINNSTPALEQATSDQVWLVFEGKGQELPETVYSIQTKFPPQLKVAYLRPLRIFLHPIQAEGPA